jgi:hypothetical protein
LNPISLSDKHFNIQYLKNDRVYLEEVYERKMISEALQQKKTNDVFKNTKIVK